MWNKYVGIPYELKGRDRNGLDCWGLVRLFYKEEYDIDLPSFSDEYQTSEQDRIQELMATQREGWVNVQDPKEGDVVLFRVLGFESHIGIYIGEKKFLHAIRDVNSGIESLDSVKWSRRVVGFYRYLPNAVTLSTVAHPLKTQRVDTYIDCSKSLSEIDSQIKSQLPQELQCDAVFMVDGKIIPKDEWSIFIPSAGQRVEYRSLLTGDDTVRTFFSIAVVVAAVYFGPELATFFAPEGVTYAAGSWQAATATAVMTVAGSSLVNSIFPVRMPELNNSLQTTKSQLLFQGGRNEANPYGAIPIVLGEFRYTPPLGATTYVETVGSDSYIRLILCWGYGELALTNLRVDNAILTSYEGVEMAHVGDYDTESSTAELAAFNAIYGKDIVQNIVGIELISDGTDVGSPWREEVLDEPDVNSINITIAFPRGLRGMYLEGGDAGKNFDAPFRGEIQYRQLDPDTLSAVSSWKDVGIECYGATFALDKAYYNIDSDAELEKVYVVHRFAVDKDRKLIHKFGHPSDRPSADASSSMRGYWDWQNVTYDTEGWYSFTQYQRIPDLASNEEEIWRVVTYGDEIYSTTDYRSSGTFTVTGCNLTSSGLKVTIASGLIDDSVAFPYTIQIGASGEEHSQAKDAFTYQRSIKVDPAYKYEVRVRRRNNSDADQTSGQTRYHKAVLDTITGYSTRNPVTNPKGVSLCMTALRIKATDQLNGQLEGITGTVQSVCKDYDSGTDTWINRPTRNPASLFRFVLQHPANAQKVADSKINLDALETWHTYCKTNSFMFDMVILDQRSLLDVLRDICAAGRASPTLRDGKWTVIIDKPQSTICQLFTPHNSWGFEGSRLLPKLPHGFRVSFNNREKNYQPDEMIVYNDGYSASNATLFEGLALAGVTQKDQIYKHARFHFAQLKLRPERYTLNADMEHLICTRGDLVRVTHDVPMWGLGTGRIKTYVDSNTLELDEAMPMDAGVQYTIRIRLEDGSTVTRTVTAKDTDGYYTTIDLTSTLTSTEGKAGNLFMFGSLSEESVELIVESIEPSENMTARLTLVDYSPAVYDSDDEVIPAFDSQITKPPLLTETKITVSPTVGTIASDESVMIRLAPNQYEYRMKVGYSNPASLPKNVAYVEGQIDIQNDKSVVWTQSTVVPLKDKSITFKDVQEGVAYKVRLRYHDSVGRFGPWVESSAHTIVGKSNPPATPTGLTIAISDTRLSLDWADNLEPDVEYYEVRTSNSGWGDSSRLYKGKTSNCLVDSAAAGTSRTWYVKAIDGAGNYSTTAASVSYTAAVPANISSITETFEDTSLTSATVTLDWSDISPDFGLSYYEIAYASTTKTAKASTITLPANWLGDRAFTVTTVDSLGNRSTGFTKTITKLAPNSVSNFRAQVIDNTVMFYWTLPAKTTLPVDHVKMRKGSTWDGGTEIGDKKGSFTTLNESLAGTYTYWAAVVDTDNNESTPVSVTVKVSEPPDFIFHGDFTSDLSGTKSSAILENSAVVLPVNTTETWASHFTSRSWTSPSDQVSAGYPIFIQPANGSGYYDETFDFGAILSSSKVTLTYSGSTVAGSPTVTPKISLSDDNVTYVDYDGYSEVYGTNFRYVKIRVTVTESTGTGLYSLTSLYVKLDAKLKTDAGSVSALSTDASGTIVNFSKEFVDIQSITLTPSGTTAATAVYDFQDSNLSSTYAVVSNVCTVTYTAHGFITGQKVRLQFSTGNGINGVYTITGYTANTFTVAMTVGNTSGNCLVYPESFRVYLFNSSGTRISGTASWNARGY